MATSSSSPSSTPSTSSSKTTASTQLQKIGIIVEFSGAASFLAGAAIAIGAHHYPVAAFVIGGAIAAFVGERLHKA